MVRAKIDGLFAECHALLTKSGFDESEIRTFDKGREFLVRDEEYDGNRLDGLSYGDWSKAVKAFPLPHRLKVEISAIDQIHNEEAISNDEFNSFVNRASGNTCTFEFRIDKDHLCQEWGLGDEQHEQLLYLFAESFESLVRNTLTMPAQLELALRLTTKKAKLRIFLRDHDTHLRGDYLEIRGGQHIDVFTDTEVEEDISIGAASAVRELSRWDWPDGPQFLTPAHLHFRIVEGQEDSLVRVLCAWWANMALVYVASRVRAENGSVIASFASPRRKCRIRLFNTSEFGRTVVPGTGRIEAFGQAAEWCYDPKWQKDRITMFRVLLSREFSTRRQPVPFNVVLAKASVLWKDLRWKWDLFIEGRVDEFAKDASDFEKDISETVEAFDEQVSDIIKGLSTTVLAAIGVVVGAIAAAVTKNSISPQVIRATLFAYMAYLAIVPGLLAMWFHLSRFSAIHSAFESRRNRFVRILPEDFVQKLSDDHISKAKTRFWLGFGANAVTLLAAFLASLLLAMWIDSFTTQVEP